MDELRYAEKTLVRLSPAGCALYGGVYGKWAPKSQGGGGVGVIVTAGFRNENKPGAAPRPYIVRWENGSINSYREEDLDPVKFEWLERKGSLTVWGRRGAALGEQE